MYTVVKLGLTSAVVPKYLAIATYSVWVKICKLKFRTYSYSYIHAPAKCSAFLLHFLAIKVSAGSKSSDSHHSLCISYLTGSKTKSKCSELSWMSCTYIFYFVLFHSISISIPGFIICPWCCKDFRNHVNHEMILHKIFS